jgi:dynein heavy chain
VAINENRNKYRPVACRGASLFFLLNSLNKVHAFYQYSLNAFVGVFCRGIDLAPGGVGKKRKLDMEKVGQAAAGEGCWGGLLASLFLRWPG